MNKKPPLYYVALQAKKAYEQASFTEYRKAEEARKQKQRREEEAKKNDNERARASGSTTSSDSLKKAAQKI